MAVRVKKHHPALKHGAYSATTILPGENAAEFEKLHREVIAEFTPDGPFERDEVASLARLMWRKQNLRTFRIAELARSHREKLVREMAPEFPPEIFPAFGRSEAAQAAEDQARKDLGDAYELVEIGDPATLDGLMNELDVHERLDAMIDKCIKRLLLVRGLKSLPMRTSLEAPKQLEAPVRKAQESNDVAL